MTNTLYSHEDGAWVVLSGAIRSVLPTSAPDAPIVELTPGDGQIVVNWSITSDGGSAITSYVVNEVSGGTSTPVQTLTPPFPSPLGYTITVANDTTLTITVTAVNAIGSATSDPVSATAQATPYNIPSGFMTLAMVGPNSSLLTAQNRRLRSDFVAPPNLPTAKTIANAGTSVNGAYYKTLTMTAGPTTLYQIYVDNNSIPPVPYAKIAITSQSHDTSIVLSGINDDTDNHNPPLANAPGQSPSLQVLSTGLNSTNQIEIVYFCCSGLDSNKQPIYAAPTAVPGPNSTIAGYSYPIYNPNTSDGGFQYGHAAGRLVQAKGSTGFTLKFQGQVASFPGMYLFSSYSQFGNPNSAGGGGTTAIDPQQGSLYQYCAIGFNGDAMKTTSRMWFDHCVIGPNLAPASDPGYHSDGFQVVGGINNSLTPLSTVWLDLSSPGTPHTIGGTSGYYGYASSNPYATLQDGDALNVWGTSWTVSYKSTHLGYSTLPGKTDQIKYIHAPFFLASNAGNAGPVQNLLIDSCFISGGQNMILDDTSVNSNNSTSGKSVTGVGGDKGFIMRRSCFDFLAPTASSTVAQLVGTAQQGSSNIIVDSYLPADTEFTIVNSAAGSAESFYTMDDGALPLDDGSGNYSVNITTNSIDQTIVNPLQNNHSDSTNIISIGFPNPNNITLPNAPNTSKVYNYGSGSPGQILQTTTYNYDLNQDVPQGTTTLQLTLIQTTAVTQIPAGEHLQIFDPIIKNGNTVVKPDTSENVVVTRPSTYDSNTGIITVTVTPTTSSTTHAASNCIIKTTDITNWIEVPAGFNYATNGLPGRNYWELSNYRADTSAPITLLQAQWAAIQWINNQPYVAPIANAGPDQTISATAGTIQLNGLGSDPNPYITGNNAGNLLSYAWQQTSGPGGTLSDATMVGGVSTSSAVRPVFTPTSLSAGQTYVFQLTITDMATKLTNTDSVTVHITS